MTDALLRNYWHSDVKSNEAFRSNIIPSSVDVQSIFGQRRRSWADKEVIKSNCDSFSVVCRACLAKSSALSKDRLSVGYF